MKITIKQHDIQDCGAACLTSIAAFYKTDISIAKVRQYACTDKHGTNILGMIKAAEKLGFVAKGVKGDETSLPLIPYPTIAHVIRKINDIELHHYVVLYSYRKKIIQIMDPATGTLDKISIEDFKKEWSGVLILMEPSKNFSIKKDKKSILNQFIDIVYPHKSVLFQSFLGALFCTALGLSTSIYIEKITDYVLTGGNQNLLNMMSVCMICILLIQIIISVFKDVIMLRAGHIIDASLILGYYKHLLKLPQSFFDTMHIGEITSRINDAVKIRNFINSTAINLIVNVLIVVLSFGLMFGYYWKLALIMLIVIPIYIIIYIISDKWNRKIERKVMEDSAGLESQLVESLNAQKTIKQFGIEDFANQKTENRFIKMLYSVYNSALNSVFTKNSSDLISRIFTIILIWCGSYYVLKGEITSGELMSFYTLIGYFTGPVANLINANKSIREATIAADRLFEIMDLEREESSEKINLTPNMISNIVFTDVSFSYGTRKEVFKDFNMTLKTKQISAIVGESGCGKTTLSNILQNLYPINKGKIQIGEFHLNNLSTSSIRKLISVVPQQISLFSGSILQNIALGEYNPDIKRVVTLINELGLSDFIEHLPNGIETQIGENGASLSGGQKQRLAIIRALYKNPEILILDEATSSLDSISEKYVQQTLQNLKNEGKTIIVIAHRLSTIKNADEIFVLKEGVLHEHGIFEDLIKLKGEFYRLWESQTL